MPGPWKAWKTKSGFPTLSTVPWKSRRKREIPTFPPPGFASMEKWKTKSRFPTFPRPLATITTVLSLKTKNQRKEVGRCAASSFPVRFSCSSFDWKMLTLDMCAASGFQLMHPTWELIGAAAPSWGVREHSAAVTDVLREHNHDSLIKARRLPHVAKTGIESRLRNGLFSGGMT